MAAQARWQYQPVEEYRIPEMSTEDSVRRKLVTTWQRFFASSSEDGKVEHTFGRLSDEQEELVIPELDCRGRIDALDEFIATPVTTHDNHAAISVLVGPPGSGVEETLLDWAAREQGEILERPEPDQLLDDYDVEIPDSDGSRPFVIPALHHHYLRHPAGLRALRKLLKRLRGAENNRRILLGCDSWAWAYLRTSVQVDAMLPSPFSLAALTGISLRDCLLRLCGGENPCPYEFRYGDDDSPVFCGRTKTHDPPNDETRNHHALFDHLASIARGIPDVAIELWKSSLRTVQNPDDTPDDETQRSGVDASRQVIWVQSFSAGELPVVPADVSRLDAIALHSLLVHGGLAENILHQLLCPIECRAGCGQALIDRALADVIPARALPSGKISRNSPGCCVLTSRTAITVILHLFHGASKPHASRKRPT